MAGQQGFLYEGRVFNRLKSKNLVPAGVKPAGPNPNLPDATFLYEGQPYKLEVKLDLRADFGQGTLNYVDGVWTLGGADTPEAEEMRRLLESVGTAEFANLEWGKKGIPNKGTVETGNFTQEMVREDYTRFKDGFKIVNKRNIWDYYAAKDTYYIQIGGYGLYYMAANPANLPIPRFDVTSRLRIRMKPSQSYPVYSYGFKTAILVQSKPQRSTMDLDRRTDLDKLAA